MRALLIRFFVCIFLLLALWVASSVGAIQWVAQKILSPLVQKDAMPQVTALASKLIDSSHCAPFKAALIGAGTGSPTAGATQHKIVLAYEAAKAAGCKKLE